MTEGAAIIDHARKPPDGERRYEHILSVNERWRRPGNEKWRIARFIYAMALCGRSSGASSEAPESLRESGWPLHFGDCACCAYVERDNQRLPRR
jgi:hypothetical protein